MYWKSDERGGVSVENFKIAKSSSRYSPSRLCGSLDDLEKHVATINRSKCTAECAVCGSPTYWKCGLCNKRICQGPGGKGCHIALHNDNMFGLIQSDFADVLGGKNTIGSRRLQTRKGKTRNGLIIYGNPWRRRSEREFTSQSDSQFSRFFC